MDLAAITPAKIAPDSSDIDADYSRLRAIVWALSGRATDFLDGRRSLAVLTLGLLLFVAGCTAIPFGGLSAQERPVRVGLDNSANETQTFEVWVVERSSTVATRRSDGITVNWSIGQGLATTSSGPYPWTKFEFPDSARLHGRFTLEPGEVNRTTVREFPRNFAVVVVLYQDPGISGWWASANCDDQALVGLEVHTRPSQYGDAWAGYGCR